MRILLLNFIIYIVSVSAFGQTPGQNCILLETANVLDAPGGTSKSNILKGSDVFIKSVTGSYCLIKRGKIEGYVPLEVLMCESSIMLNDEYRNVQVKIGRAHV